MKIVFASHGSLGDLVPFLEIGKVLVAGGHRVSVATHLRHRTVVEAAGLGFAPMRPDHPDDPALYRRFMNRWSGPAVVYREFLAPAIAASDADLMAAVADADILVSVTLALAAPIVAARTGMPWLSAAFQPLTLFSAHDPPKLPLLPFRRGRPAYNRRLLDIAKTAVESWAAPLREHRRRAGLGEYPAHPVFRGQHSPQGVLALYSPLFAPLPPDAPPRTVQTGQVLQSGGGTLPAPIAEFLADGPPPIVFTLGSASAQAPRHFFEASARMADRLGRRALLLVGREENRIDATRSMMVATTAPYQAVFPHAAMVVQQGGIGTIALALAAQKPMLLVPFAHDQPDNSARAARLGVARVLPRWRYGRAAGVIARILADRAMHEAAARAGAVIRAERGAERAAAHILAAAARQP